MKTKIIFNPKNLHIFYLHKIREIPFSTLLPVSNFGDELLTKSEAENNYPEVREKTAFNTACNKVNERLQSIPTQLVVLLLTLFVLILLT